MWCIIPSAFVASNSRPIFHRSAYCTRHGSRVFCCDCHRGVTPGENRVPAPVPEVFPSHGISRLSASWVNNAFTPSTLFRTVPRPLCYPRGEAMQTKKLLVRWNAAPFPSPVLNHGSIGAGMFEKETCTVSEWLANSSSTTTHTLSYAPRK